MSFLTNWLLSVIAVAFLVSLAEALMPEQRIREVGHLVGGLLLLLALLQPLLSVRLPEWEVSMDAYLAEITQREQGFQRQQEESIAALIKEQSEAYVEKEADALGLSVRAVVETAPGGEGYPIPAVVSLDIAYHDALAERIEQGLGITKEHQIWNTKEMR